MARSMQKRKSSRYNNLSALDWIEKDGKLMQLKTTQFTLTEHRFLACDSPANALIKFLCVSVPFKDAIFPTSVNLNDNFIVGGSKKIIQKNSNFN